MTIMGAVPQAPGTWPPNKKQIYAPKRRASRWRNGLAHWTSNSKVAGSSPARDVFCFPFFFSTFATSN